MQILLFPAELPEERKKGAVSFSNINDMDNKGLLVTTDLSAIKINFTTPDSSIIFDEERKLLSCSLRVNNIPFVRLKDTSLSSVLAKMPEFKSHDQVKKFIELLSKDPDIQSEMGVKDLVLDDPLKGDKTIVLGTTEKQGSADTQTKVVKGKEVKAVETTVVDPPRSQGKKGKQKGKDKKKKFATSLKDPSELPKFMKEKSIPLSSPPPAPKLENKVATPPQKQTSSPKSNIKDDKSTNEILKEELEKRLEDDARLWPGGLVVKSMLPFKAKGYCIGHIMKPNDRVNAQFLIVGTPVDGNVDRLSLIFPDEPKAKFYFEAASKHPKLEKFMAMCSIKPLADFKNDGALETEGLLIQDPKTYIEYITNRLA